MGKHVWSAWCLFPKAWALLKSFWFFHYWTPKFGHQMEPKFQNSKNQSFQIEFFDSGKKGLIFGFPTSFYFLDYSKGCLDFWSPKAKTQKDSGKKIKKSQKPKEQDWFLTFLKNYPKKTIKKIDFLDLWANSIFSLAVLIFDNIDLSPWIFCFDCKIGKFQLFPWFFIFEKNLSFSLGFWRFGPGRPKTLTPFRGIERFPLKPWEIQKSIYLKRLVFAYIFSARALRWLFSLEYIALHFAPNGFARGTATNDSTTKRAQMEPIIRQRGLFQILFTSISHSRLLAGGWILSCFESCVDAAVSTMHGSTSQVSTYCCLETTIKRLPSAPPEFWPIIVSACSWTWVAAMECVICSRRQATWDSQIAKKETPKKLNNKMNNHILIPVLSKISLQTYVLTTRVIEMNSKILQSWDTTSKHLKPPSAFTQPHKWFQPRTARSCIATLHYEMILGFEDENCLQMLHTAFATSALTGWHSDAIYLATPRRKHTCDTLPERHALHMLPMQNDYKVQMNLDSICTRVQLLWAPFWVV